MVSPSSASSPIFRGHARRRGKNFGAVAQSLGRTSIAFIKIFRDPAAKRSGSDLFEIAAPEIGEVVSGVDEKNSKLFAKKS